MLSEQGIVEYDLPSDQIKAASAQFIQQSWKVESPGCGADFIGQGHGTGIGEFPMHVLDVDHERVNLPGLFGGVDGLQDRGFCQCIRRQIDTNSIVS